MHRGRGIKQKVVALRLSEPTLTYEEIAERIGTKRGYVQSICAMTGVGCGYKGTRTRPSKYLDAFLAVHRENPEWGALKIARAIGCPRSLAHTLLKRHGSSRTDIIRVGAAALAAGFTVQQIEAMANARHA
jgi:hypothetical protein